MSVQTTDTQLVPGVGHTMNRAGLDEEMIEQDVKKLCAEVLGRPVAKVKLNRTFLAQGGDSLLAIKLMGRCRDAGYSINIQDILQAASVKELCRCAIPAVAGEAAALPTGGLNGTNTLQSCAEPPVISLPKATYTHPKVLKQLKSIALDPIRDIEDIFPCSATQEVFLIAQALHPELYQCTAVLEVKSATPNTPLDDSRLRAAWGRVVLQHPSLRTVFIDSIDRSGHFDQVVLREAITSLEFQDNSGDQEGATSASKHFAERRRLAFPTAQATHRVAICKQSEYSAVFRIDISHAVVDGESFYIILHDLAQAYANDGSVTAVMRYREFVTHQRQLPHAKTVAYWSQYLAGAEPSLFPVNRGGSEREALRTLPLRITDVDPQPFCAKHNITIANLCQVAWALVLGSYTASDDICFSYVSSGRDAPLRGIERTVGAFVDTLIFRLQISGTITVAEALTKAKDGFLAGLAHPGALTTATFVDNDSPAKGFSRLRGNTLMSCQRRGSAELPQGPGLAFGVIDAVNPTEVSK